MHPDSMAAKITPAPTSVEDKERITLNAQLGDWRERRERLLLDADAMERSRDDLLRAANVLMGMIEQAEHILAPVEAVPTLPANYASAQR